MPAIRPVLSYGEVTPPTPPTPPSDDPRSSSTPKIKIYVVPMGSGEDVFSMRSKKRSPVRRMLARAKDTLIISVLQAANITRNFYLQKMQLPWFRYQVFNMPEWQVRLPDPRNFLNPGRIPAEIVIGSINITNPHNIGKLSPDVLHSVAMLLTEWKPETPAQYQKKKDLLRSLAASSESRLEHQYYPILTEVAHAIPTLKEEDESEKQFLMNALLQKPTFLKPEKFREVPTQEEEDELVSVLKYRFSVFTTLLHFSSSPFYQNKLLEISKSPHLTVLIDLVGTLMVSEIKDNDLKTDLLKNLLNQSPFQSPKLSDEPSEDPDENEAYYREMVLTLCGQLKTVEPFREELTSLLAHSDWQTRQDAHELLEACSIEEDKNTIHFGETGEAFIATVLSAIFNEHSDPSE